jgi:hypothetical protein
MAESTKEKTTGTTIKYCNCTSAFQDAKYGPGMRVFNRGLKTAKCTVCGRVA